MPYDILDMIIIDIHNMDKSKNKTKYIAKETLFCNRSVIQHTHEECKEDKVGYKTCLTLR